MRWSIVALFALAACRDTTLEGSIEAFGAAAAGDVLLVGYQRHEVKLRAGGGGESDVLASTSSWSSLRAEGGADRASTHAVEDDAAPQGWSVPWAIPVDVADDGTAWPVFETPAADGGVDLWPAPGGAEAAEPLPDPICRADGVALADGGFALAARRMVGDVVLYHLDADGAVAGQVQLADLGSRAGCEPREAVAAGRRGDEVAVAVLAAGTEGGMAVYTGPVGGGGTTRTLDLVGPPLAVWPGPGGPRALSLEPGGVGVATATGGQVRPVDAGAGCVAADLDASGTLRIVEGSDTYLRVHYETGGVVSSADLDPPGVQPTGCAVAGGTDVAHAMWYATDSASTGVYDTGSVVLRTVTIHAFGVGEEHTFSLTPAPLR